MTRKSDRHSIVEWDEDEVQKWLAQLGYPQYAAQIKEHRISGDILCMVDSETLKKIGITSTGQRISILKAIYNLKIAHDIPLDAGDYVPPSEVQALKTLSVTVEDQEHRICTLEEENRALNNILQTFFDDYNNLRESLGVLPQPQLATQSDIIQKGTIQPFKLDIHKASSRQAVPPYTRAHQFSFPSLNVSDKPRSQPAPSQPPSIPLKPTRQDSSDNLKNYKVSLEDPTWKVLPAALKKYNINNDEWEDYAMFIGYDNRIERRLEEDEQPLLLFQKLKEAAKKPVFRLKNIKTNFNSSVTTEDTIEHNKAQSINRPAKLEANDIQTSPSGLVPEPEWSVAIDPYMTVQDGEFGATF